MQDRKAFPLCIKSRCQFLVGTHLLPFPTVRTAMADFFTSTSLLLFLGACENTLQQHSSLLASFRECCRCFSMLFGLIASDPLGNFAACFTADRHTD
jgi:hypothetical protein